MPDKPVTFSEQGARRIIRAVKRVETPERIGQGGGPPTPAGLETLWAKLTEKDGHKFAWTQQRMTDTGEWEDKPEGLEGTLTERTAHNVNGDESPQVGDIVLLRRIVRADKAVLWAFDGRRAGFHARVAGSTQDGTNNRWTYTVEEAHNSAANPWLWAAVTGGRTGNAYNRYEIPTLDDTGVTIKPIPNGRPVFVEIGRDSNGDEIWWFSEANDLECDEA